MAARIPQIRKESCAQQSSVPAADLWSGETWFASFSLPHRYRSARGYVTLEVKNIYPDVDFSIGKNAESLVRNRWSNGLWYVHQISSSQYPVLSAKNYAMQNTGYSDRRPFLHIGLESWFFPEEN